MGILLESENTPVEYLHRNFSTSIRSSVAESTREKKIVRPSRVTPMTGAVVAVRLPSFDATVVERLVVANLKNCSRVSPGLSAVGPHDDTPATRPPAPS
jgi:hypothetical protein